MNLAEFIMAVNVGMADRNLLILETDTALLLVEELLVNPGLG
jgi:hypothetical protein